MGAECRLRGPVGHPLDFPLAGGRVSPILSGSAGRARRGAGMATEETVMKAAGAIALLILAIPASAAISAAYRTPAPLPPPPAPYTLTLSADGGRVDLQGVIDFGVTADLAALLAGTPDVRLLRLQSPGGRVAEARGLVNVVRRFALATTARGDCASACTLVFIAGHSRALDPGARLGFHGYNLRAPIFGLIDPAAEMARDAAVFRAAGVSPAFLDRAMAVPHQTMWFPEPAELIASGIIDRR